MGLDAGFTWDWPVLLLGVELGGLRGDTCPCSRPWDSAQVCTAPPVPGPPLGLGMTRPHSAGKETEARTLNLHEVALQVRGKAGAGTPAARTPGPKSRGWELGRGLLGTERWAGPCAGQVTLAERVGASAIMVRMSPACPPAHGDERP